MAPFDNLKGTTLPALLEYTHTDIAFGREVTGRELIEAVEELAVDEWSSFIEPQHSDDDSYFSIGQRSTSTNDQIRIIPIDVTVYSVADTFVWPDRKHRYVRVTNSLRDEGLPGLSADQIQAVISGYAECLRLRFAS